MGEPRLRWAKDIIQCMVKNAMCRVCCYSLIRMPAQGFFLQLLDNIVPIWYNFTKHKTCASR